MLRHVGPSLRGSYEGWAGPGLEQLERMKTAVLSATCVPLMVHSKCYRGPTCGIQPVVFSE